jgi:hypothetical protein
MIENPDVIPIAVVVAVAVFVARELLEFIRRFRTNTRKLSAIRKLVAAECERNDFAIKRMLDQVQDIKEGIPKEAVISIEQTVRGPRLAIREKDEQLASSAPVPLIQTASVEKYLFEAAALDKTLFDYM